MKTNYMMTIEVTATVYVNLIAERELEEDTVKGRAEELFCASLPQIRPDQVLHSTFDAKNGTRLDLVDYEFDFVQTDIEEIEESEDIK